MGAQLLADPSFETIFDFGTPWAKNLGPGCVLDATFRSDVGLHPERVRSGQRSVSYLLTNSGGFTRCGYVEASNDPSLPLRRGEKHSISAWVKTENWKTGLKLWVKLDGMILLEFSQASESGFVQLGPLIVIPTATSAVLRFEAPADGQDGQNRYFHLDDASFAYEAPYVLSGDTSGGSLRADMVPATPTTESALSGTFLLAAATPIPGSVTGEGSASDMRAAASLSPSTRSGLGSSLSSRAFGVSLSASAKGYSLAPRASDSTAEPQSPAISGAPSALDPKRGVL